uniref:Myosin motor domain-containing protein n=1 Tax=Alexandrium monilatum TaxID=311494 RepID=A0A7S4T555_9DINO
MAPKRQKSGITSAIEPGTLVWVPDTETGQVWVKAEVEAIDARAVRVKTDDGSVRAADLAKLLRCNTDTWKADEGLTAAGDLSSLTHLHEPEVLQALQLRFDIDKIYTFCGPILIVVNPFKSIAGLYSRLPAREPHEHEDPHIFLVARKAFGSLVDRQESQVVLISGESGAGKTESTKHVLRFLTTRLGGQGSGGADDSDGTLRKVLSSNPLLEAFGNACTTRNDNSSRFGKFIELQFEGRGRETKFRCAAIDTYLLEKVRITELHKGERSYHIFYQACAALRSLGASHQDLPLHLFGEATQFQYLRKSDRLNIANTDDAALFEETMQAMGHMGIGQDERAQILKLVAAVLHIGNIPVGERPSGAEIAVDDASFRLASELLGIQPGPLARALSFRLISVSASEKYDSPLTKVQSESLRESFARTLYALLFDFLVHRVNQTLAGSDTVGSASKRFFAGVLDIFGFEHFEKNSFEQLCINFANERLQQLFNQFVFKTEMELYRAEDVSCDFTDFPDNQDIIDMIQAKSSSIFTLLDEECRLPKGSDQALVQKLWRTFEKNPRFKVEPRKPSSFSVVHFAGTVSYDTANFLEKNLDELGELLKQALESSEAHLVKDILKLKSESEAARSASAPAKPGQRGGKLKPNTVSTDFKNQLETLMSKMGSASPHFVRCIKPNPEKRPDMYHRPSVAEQLRSGGVIEALLVQRSGFPCRWTHQECWDNIRIVFKADQRAQFDKLAIGDRIRQALSKLSAEMGWPTTGGAGFAIGKTKVFFKQFSFESLEGARMFILNEAATKIQSHWKRFCFRRVYVHIRAAIVTLQAGMRRYRQRRRLWDGMAPEARRASRLFRAVLQLLGERKAGGAAARTGRDDDAPCDASEDGDPGPRGRAGSGGPVAADGAELQRLRAEKEGLEQRLAEEQQAAAAAAEKERQRRQEELLQAERKWRSAQEAMKGEHEHEVRTLSLQLSTLKDEEAVKRGKLEQELQCMRRDADVRRAEFEQQVALTELREREAKARVDELEREVKRLREELATQAERHAVATSELHASHVQALSHAAEQHEAQRQAYLKQTEDLREHVDETYRKQLVTAGEREMEHAQRFREEVQQVREREAAQSRRHEGELASLRQKETERARRWQTELAEAKRNESDHRLQIQVMEQQVLDLSTDNQQLRKLVETQQEETKRTHASLVEMLEQRHAEREQTLTKELEMCTAQKNEQIKVLRQQLEFQKRELAMTGQQEVEMIKKQWQQRERQLLQMIDQARRGQAEREKTAEVHLALKAQQQDELHRCADVKARHLEQSARRQQELYEQHVEQLTQQMRQSQENFRRQLEEVQAQSDQRVAGAVAQLAMLEAQVKEDQEKRLAQEAADREDVAFRLAEAAKLRERTAGLEAANRALQAELAHANAGLVPGRRGSAVRSGDFIRADPLGDDAQPELVRRLSEPIPKLVADGSGRRRPRPPMRLLLGPRKMSLAFSPELAPVSATRGQRIRFADLPDQQDRRRGLVLDQPSAVRKSITDLMGGQPRAHRVAPPASTLEFLRPTLQSAGQLCTGEVGQWQQIAATPASLGGQQAGSAITVLAFAEAPSDEGCWLLAAATKGGTLSVYSVRKTAHEREDFAVADDGADASPAIQVKKQFIAHAKAITSMSFSVGGLELMTTSSDWHVRIWLVEDGSLKNRFVDSSLVVCALPMPGPDWSMVMANAGAVLRLISNEGNPRQQKVRLDHYARSLVLALDGTRLLAGTSGGHIHALDVDAHGLRIIGKQRVSSQAALTCLVVAPCADGLPPLVVANVMDSTICVLQANAQMTNFTVLKRLHNAHKLLPLRCCHVPAAGGSAGSSGGAGFIASACEDGSIHVIDLDGFEEMRLQGHGAAVIDVAATENSGLLASGDVHGRVILWRRGTRAAVGTPNGHG